MRLKGAHNTYISPAKTLAWNDLTEEQRQAYVAAARANYNRARSGPESMKRRAATMVANNLTVEELERLVAEVKGSATERTSKAGAQ